MFYRLEFLNSGTHLSQSPELRSKKRKPTCQISQLVDEPESDSDDGSEVADYEDDITEYSRVRVRFRPLRLPSFRPATTQSKWQGSETNLRGVAHMPNEMGGTRQGTLNLACSSQLPY
jgi:hypothetical protein